MTLGHRVGIGPDFLNGEVFIEILYCQVIFSCREGGGLDFLEGSCSANSLMVSAMCHLGTCSAESYLRLKRVDLMLWSRISWLRVVTGGRVLRWTLILRAGVAHVRNSRRAMWRP